MRQGRASALTCAYVYAYVRVRAGFGQPACVLQYGTATFSSDYQLARSVHRLRTLLYVAIHKLMRVPHQNGYR